MTDRESCIVLNMISGIGYARYSALVGRFGSPAAALEADARELLELKGFGEQLAEAVGSWRKTIDLDGELALAERAGATIYTLFDDGYPAELRELADPPLAIYCRGTLPDFSRGAVAVVGSRRMSGYGRRMAEKVSAEAVLAGWVVVSGLAFGVDAAAHAAALDHGGTTVGVLGGGLMRIHPQEHVPLAARMVEAGGAVMTEYPMCFPVSRQSFPRRNRIVAALAQATVVVEAGLDSGALITAKLALEQGKSVFAFPGRADEPQAAGCNRLIRDAEAKLLESFQDVVDDFAYLPGLGPELGEAAADYLAAPPEKSGAPELFNDLERAVYAVLAEKGPGKLDELVTATGAAAGELAGTLLALEMRDIAVKSPDGTYSLH